MITRNLKHGSSLPMGRTAGKEEEALMSVAPVNKNRGDRGSGSPFCGVGELPHPIFPQLFLSQLRGRGRSHTAETATHVMAVWREGPSRQMQDIWETAGLAPEAANEKPLYAVRETRRDASKVPQTSDSCGAPGFAESRPTSIPRKGPFSTAHSLQMRPSGPRIGPSADNDDNGGLAPVLSR
jgi:hypothetical protein